MIAGYISAETYRAVSYYCTYYKDLSYSDIKEYVLPMRDELKYIYENDYVVNSLYFLEYLENSKSLSNTLYFKHIEKCLNEASSEIKILVNSIGKDIFVKNYLFNTPESIKGLHRITNENYFSVIHFKSEVLDSLIKEFDNKDIPEYNQPDNIEPKITPIVAELNQTQHHDFEVAINSSDKNELLDISTKDNSLDNDKPIEDNIDSNETCLAEEVNESYLHSSDSILPVNLPYQNESAQINCCAEPKILSSYGINKDSYISFLNSLSSEKFQVFEQFLLKVMNNCSVRTFNGIKYLGARNFYENYLFEDDSKFLSIRNFGKKSLLELLNVKPQIIDFVVSHYESSGNVLIEEKPSSLDIFSKIDFSLKELLGDTKYSLVQNELNLILHSFSVRTQNGIRNYKGDFIEDFVHQEKSILSIRHIGRKSEMEIRQIINKLKEYIKNLPSENCSQEELSFLETKALLKTILDDFSFAFFEENGHFPMLHILENATKEMITSYRKGIFNEYLPLFENHSAKTLELIASSRDLTRERIRQIVAKELKQFSSIQVIGDEIKIPGYENSIGKINDWEYVSQALSQSFLWDDSELYFLFANEKLSLSFEYIKYFLKQIFSDSFSLIGNSPFLESKQRNWRNSYLVSRNLSDAFDFNKMLSIIDAFEQSSTTDITMTTQELVIDMFFEAWNCFDFSLVEDIKDVVAKLLISEKDIVPEIDLSFTIHGLKKEEPCDILYQILLECGEPITSDTLFEKYCEISPGRYKSSASLTPIIMNDARMCFLGYNKLVTLQEWDHIKIGSIRDLLVQYLSQFDEPQHIDNIVKYIQEHRNTSESSIRSTMSSGNQFSLFACGFYGLVDKTYPDRFYLSESEQNSLNRFADFEEFLIQNKRFPFTSSSDKEEELLAYWWYRLCNQQDIPTLLCEQIKRIRESYSHLPKTKTEHLWLCKCNEYSDFVIKFGTKPTNRNIIEIELLRWFDKAFQDINEGKLSTMQEQAFIELCKKL